jgi:hypothetical protein
MRKSIATVSVSGSLSDKLAAEHLRLLAAQHARPRLSIGRRTVPGRSRVADAG